MNCLWCETEFEPRANGGKRQKFCSRDCRQDFFAACRDWAVAEVEAGRVPVSTIRRGLEQRARSLQRDLAPVCVPTASATRKRPDGAPEAGRMEVVA